MMLADRIDALLPQTQCGQCGYHGCRPYAEPEKVVGRNVVFIANLAPRKMRFGLSEGMILSAGTGGADLFLLDADQGAQPGATVR